MKPSSLCDNFDKYNPATSPLRPLGFFDELRFCDVISNLQRNKKHMKQHLMTCWMMRNAMPISSCSTARSEFEFTPQSWWESHSEAKVSVTCRENGVIKSWNKGVHRKESNPKYFKVDPTQAFQGLEDRSDRSFCHPWVRGWSWRFPGQGLWLMTNER